MKKISILFASILLITAVFTSCKKDDSTTAGGTASADLVIGSTASGTWTATSATAVKTGSNFVITAQGPSGSSMVLALNNVTGPGTYNFSTDSRLATYIYAGKTYTSTKGGASVSVASITGSTISGTFNIEMFEGTTATTNYLGLNNGKFTASF